MVQIDIVDYLDMVDKELKEAINAWGGPSHWALKDKLLDLLESWDGGDVPSPSVVSDNWVVNGEIIEREEDFTPNGQASDFYEQYNGNWDEFCENEGQIWDDKYCCVRLGF